MPVTAREIGLYGVSGKSDLPQGRRRIAHGLGKLHPNNPQAVGWRETRFVIMWADLTVPYGA